MKHLFHKTAYPSCHFLCILNFGVVTSRICFRSSFLCCNHYFNVKTISVWQIISLMVLFNVPILGFTQSLMLKKIIIHRFLEIICSFNVSKLHVTFFPILQLFQVDQIHLRRCTETQLYCYLLNVFFSCKAPKSSEFQYRYDFS